MASAAQVARSFFTDVADEVHGAVRLNTRFLEGSRDGENDRESAIVVTDSWRAQLVAVALHRDVGSFRKHGVEVSGNDDRWSRADSFALGDHVADRVDAHVSQTERFQALLVLGAARRFFERRRRNLRQLDLLLQRPRVVGFEDVERRANLRVGRRYGGLRGERRRQRRDRQEGQDFSHASNVSRRFAAVIPSEAPIGGDLPHSDARVSLSDSAQGRIPSAERAVPTQFGTPT